MSVFQRKKKLDYVASSYSWEICRINNYTFNMEAMTSFEGDTGPYLQYAHSRLCSIKRRANLTDEELQSADLSLLTEQHAVNVVRMLSQYPDTVQNTLKTLEPTTVLTYLFKMSHAVSSSYDHLQVVGSEKELMKARMALYDAARIVLANGMKLLGLTPLERYALKAPVFLGEKKTHLQCPLRLFSFLKLTCLSRM